MRNKIALIIGRFQPFHLGHLSLIKRYHQSSHFIKKLKYTEVKEILHFTPSAILIIDNEVFIFSYEDKLTCIHILTKSIASSFSQFFDDLWKITK